MGLLWAEGFEAFASAANTTQDGLEESYVDSGGISAVKLQAGRTGGLALELTSTSTIVNTDKILAGGGAEQTIGFAYKRVSGTGQVILIKLNASSGGFATSFWELRQDNAGVLQLYLQLVQKGSNGSLPNDSAWHYVHLHYLIDGTVGFFNVYVDGVLQITYTGHDTTGTIPEGGSEIQRIRFQSASTTTILIDDVYVNSGQLLLEGVVETLFPAGAGANTTWTPSAGSNYQNVDEKPMDGDTTYNQSSGSNQVDTFDFDNLATTDVQGIEVHCIVKSTSGSTNVRPVIRSGGTDYPAGANTSISTSYVSARLKSDTNPATGLAWTTTTINAAEFGIKAI